MQNLPTAVERSQGKISGILAELHGMVRMKEYYTIRYVCLCVRAPIYLLISNIYIIPFVLKNEKIYLHLYIFYFIVNLSIIQYNSLYIYIHSTFNSINSINIKLILNVRLLLILITSVLPYIYFSL